jgi:hypothetical protein
MIKLSKKSLLLFVSAIAMAAFALPSMASAATFDGVGNHTLTSSNLSFTSTGLGGGSICTSSVFEVAVSAASARVTAATFSGCTGTDGLLGVPATPTATNLPWTVTPVAGGIVIDGIHVVVHFPAASLNVTLSGSLLGGAVTNTTHTLTYTGGTGLLATASTGGSATATVSGDFRDDQGTLAVT